MKKLVLIVLIFTLLIGCLPFVSLSADSGVKTEEYIYNSDLFYGYSTYLATPYNGALIALEQYRMQTTYNIIHQEYINTDHFYISVVSQGLSIATDPAGTVKYFTDYVGATNFQFNDELDKANVTFVKKLCETNLMLGEAGSLIKENNKYVKKMNGFLKAVQLVKKAGLLDEAYYEGKDKAEVYSTIYEQSMAYYQKYFTQINPSLSFNTQLHTALSEMTNALGGVTDAADFTYALCLSLLMQDAQIEIIQDIIDTQPTTSTLHKGLTRLKNQLKSGWMSYFIDTFVKGQAYEQVVGEISGKINSWIMGNWTSYYSAVTAVVKVVNTVIFEWLLGADYSAYRSALMLDNYASDLYISVNNKALTFQQGGFTTKDIEKYELLFNAYIAMSEVSLDACQKLAIYNTTYNEIYLDERLEFYNNDDIYTKYLNDVKTFILSIPKENRIITDFGTWTISKDTKLVSVASDVIEENCIYTVEGSITSNLTIENGTTTIPEDANVVINGNVTVGTKTYSEANLKNNGKTTITGDLEICGGYHYGAYYGSVENSGELIIGGALTTENFSYTSFKQSEADASVTVGGNVSFASKPSITAGTIIFNGTEQQTVNNLKAYNIEVTNSKGIKYLSGVDLYGNYIANGNPIDNSGCTLYIYGENSKLDSKSDYKTIQVKCNWNLSNSVTGNTTIASGTTTIPEDANVVINGNVTVGNKTSSKANLKNNGKTTITGDLEICGGYYNGAYYGSVENSGELIIGGALTTENFSYTSFKQSEADASVTVGGNVSFASKPSITAGTIIFNGTEQQTVKNLKAPIVVIQNASEQGVVFATQISPTTLFNHNGCVFELQAGGKFVDYDGDGMLDNVDPHPTNTLKKLGFKGASLSLHYSLILNYKVDASLFGETGYSDPFVVFRIGNTETIVREYTIKDGRYVFEFVDMAPTKMTETIYSTLYATYNGVRYSSETREYSVAQYCYDTLDDYSGDQYAELRTLVVDLLNYGTQSQIYMNYNMDNLANAMLTDTQKQWGTVESPVLENVLNTKYETVNNPLALWKGAALRLEEAVIMRFKLSADDIDGLTVKIKTKTNEWEIPYTDFIKTDGGYYVYFNGLHAAQMSESVYLTVYKNDAVISNTVRFSIESYAYSNQNSSNEKLAALVKAMMIYGKSAYNYTN